MRADKACRLSSLDNAGLAAFCCRLSSMVLELGALRQQQDAAAAARRQGLQVTTLLTLRHFIVCIFTLRSMELEFGALRQEQDAAARACR